MDIQPPLAIHTLEETNQAALSGTLVTSGECILLETSEGAYGVGWPRGTTWDPANRELTVRGRTARIGDAVSLGGSQIDVASNLRDAVLWENPPLAGCVGDRGLLIAGNIEVPEAGP